MKTIVIVSYYHLLHAIATALSLDEKPALVVCTEFTKMEDSLVDNIRASGVFNSVIKTDTKDFLYDFLVELKKTKGKDDDDIKTIGTRLFDEYIDSYYYSKFKGLDFEDDIYIYTDFHLILYSVNKHFNNIILCEDGYKVMYKRYSVYKIFGYFKMLKRFIAIDAYPKMAFECDKISTLLCSGDYDGLPEHLRKKVVVWDYKEAVRNHYEEYKKVINEIFPIEHIDIQKNAVLLIEQPLYRTDFCSDLEYYLFYKKLVTELSENQQVIIKPHPAGKKAVDVFENERTTVLPKWMPVECLNYANTCFDEIVTFYSSSLELIDNTKRQTALINQNTVNKEHPVDFIHEYIDGEVIDIGIFVYYDKVKDELFKEVSRFYKKNKRYAFHLNLIVNEKEAKAKKIAQKLEKKNHDKVCVFKINDFNQDQILKVLINNRNNNDYSIAITGNNKTDEVKKIIKMLHKGSMGHCVGVHHLCGRNIIICNPLDKHIITAVVNTLWSNEILRRFESEGVCTSWDAIKYVYDNKISTDCKRRHFLCTQKECIEDIKRFSSQCDHSELADIFKAYHFILNGIPQRNLSLNELYDAEEYDLEDIEVAKKGTFVNILFNALREENDLRDRHFRRVKKLENSGSVSLTLKMIQIKNRIKKKYKKLLKIIMRKRL